MKRAPERLLTVGEVAQLAGVSTTAVRVWAEKGKLAYSLVGLVRGFRRRDVIRFLEARKKQHTVT